MDEAKLNTVIQQKFTDFKDQLYAIIREQPPPAKLLEFVQGYEFALLSEDDYMKKKRVKNPIPFHEKCIAKRANGEQCSRRKKTDSEYCGTHTKARPHGIIILPEETSSNAESSIVKKEIEVWLEDINGIQYWINDSGTVYDHDDIKENKENPRVIAHYEKSVVNGEEVYKIIQN